MFSFPKCIYYLPYKGEGVKEKKIVVIKPLFRKNGGLQDTLLGDFCMSEPKKNSRIGSGCCSSPKARLRNTGNTPNERMKPVQTLFSTPVV